MKRRKIDDFSEEKTSKQVNNMTKKTRGGNWRAHKMLRLNYTHLIRIWKNK